MITKEIADENPNGVKKWKIESDHAQTLMDDLKRRVFQSENQVSKNI